MNGSPSNEKRSLATIITSISNSGKLNDELNNEQKWAMHGISHHDWMSRKFICHVLQLENVEKSHQTHEKINDKLCAERTCEDNEITLKCKRINGKRNKINQKCMAIVGQPTGSGWGFVFGGYLTSPRSVNWWRERIETTTESPLRWTPLKRSASAIIAIW